MGSRSLSGAVQRLRQLLLPRAPVDCTDGDLLQRFTHQGDQEAFATLVHRHGGLVLGVCRRVLGDVHRAEDAFQATFLVLARKASSLDRHRPVAAWLHTVAQRVALRVRTGEARRKRVEERAVKRNAGLPAEEAAWTDLAPVLDAELGYLPEKYRLPLVLCYLQGATHEQAASQLGWPVGTVRGRLARGRELLRRRLTRRGLTLSAAGLTALLTADAASAAVTPALVASVLAVVAQPGTAPAIVSLAQGVIRSMLFHKLKWLGATLLVAGMLVGSALVVHPWRLLPEARAVPTAAAPEPATPSGLAQLRTDRIQSADHIVNGAPEREIKMLATVGQVPVGQAAAVLQAFDGGTLELLAPRADMPLAILLASPQFQARDHSTVTSLTRQKNLLTLTVRTWMDNGAYDANRKWQKLDLVLLPRLEGGDYELRIVREDMFQDVRLKKPDLHYHLRARPSATLKFQVAAQEAETVGKAPALAQADLRPGEFTREEHERSFDPPLARSYPIQGTEPGAKAALGLEVGTFDFDTWSRSEPPALLGGPVRAQALPAELPKLPVLQPPTATDSWYAVVTSPKLNTGEGMSLHAIEYRQREVILRVALWTDREERLKNIPLQWFLVVPLKPERAGEENRVPAGEYRVRVEWEMLDAAREPFTQHFLLPAENVQRKRWFEGVAERSQATITIR